MPRPDATRTTPRTTARTTPRTLVSPPHWETELDQEPPGARLRAAAAAAALVALLVGVPVALGVLVGWPLPRSIPTAEGVRGALTQQLPWEAVVKAIVCLAWLAWAQLVACVAVEARAALTEAGRGPLTAPRIPLARLNQALARRLVTAVLVVLTSTGSWSGTAAATSVGLTPAKAATGTRVNEPAPARATDDPVANTPRPSPAALPAVSAVAAGEVADLKVYVVRPPNGASFDCLWDIAERHLGDALRYREIFELNRGHVQPDGATLREEDLIRPGWTLLLPADAVGLREAGVMPDPPPAPSPPIVAEQPAPPPVVAPSPAPAPPTSRPTAASDPGLAPSAAVDGRPTVEDAGDIGEEQIGDVVDVRAGLAGGGLLAAGLLLALARLRRRQHRSRRTGRRIRLPDRNLAAVEVALRVAAEPDDLEFLDKGLRTLGLALATWTQPLPSVAGARLTVDSLELLLAAAAPDAPAPFIAAENDRVWVLASMIHVGMPAP